MNAEISYDKWFSYFGCNDMRRVKYSEGLQKLREGLGDELQGDFGYFFQNGKLYLVGKNNLFGFSLDGAFPVFVSANTIYQVPASVKENFNESLKMAREQRAQDAYEGYDFGDWAATDQDGWNRDGKYWSRRVYGDKNEGPENDRFTGSFGVEFEDGTDKIVDTWFQQ